MNPHQLLARCENPFGQHCIAHFFSTPASTHDTVIITEWSSDTAHGRAKKISKELSSDFSAKLKFRISDLH